MKNKEFKTNKSKLKIRNKLFYKKSPNNLVNNLLTNKSLSKFTSDIKDLFHTDKFNDLIILLDSKSTMYLENEDLKE